MTENNTGIMPAWHIKYRLDKIEKASRGIYGISQVINEIFINDDCEGAAFEFCNRGYVKGSLVDSIEVLTAAIGDYLDQIREMTGLPVDE